MAPTSLGGTLCGSSALLVRIEQPTTASGSFDPSYPPIYLPEALRYLRDVPYGGGSDMHLRPKPRLPQRHACSTLNARPSSADPTWIQHGDRPIPSHQQEWGVPPPAWNGLPCVLCSSLLANEPSPDTAPLVTMRARSAAFSPD